jgi:salicylate hydroxylase
VLKVAIVGAGIGGLTLAIALRQRGVDAQVYEQATALGEIGAAVALSANGTRLLDRVGVGAELAAVSTEPTELVFRDGRDGSRVAAHPVRDGGWYRAHYGAPYYGVHRKELQRILGTACGTDGLHLGRRLTEVQDGPDAVRLGFADGSAAEADVLVGADGVRSAVRGWLTGADDTVYSGASGFRGVVPVEALPSLPEPEAIQFWMGAGAHLLHYAAGGGYVNFLAVVEGPERWPDRDVWRLPATPDEAAAAFEGWHPAVLEMLAGGAPTERWALFGVRSLPRWSRGRVVLLGDAAHGMVPHQGQGANQTIEDAVLLADLLAAAGPLPDVLAEFESVRRGRTRRVQRLSWATNRQLHLPPGPAADDRDRALRDLPREIGWIHSYDVQAAVHSAAGPR